MHDEDRNSRPSPGDARTDGKCLADSFAEPALHDFGTFVNYPPPPDVSLTTARNRLPVAGKRGTDSSDLMAPGIGGRLL